MSLFDIRKASQRRYHNKKSDYGQYYASHYGTVEYSIQPRRQRYWRRRSDGVRQRYWVGQKSPIKVRESARVDLYSYSTRELREAIKISYDDPPRGRIAVNAGHYIKYHQNYSCNGRWVTSTLDIVS